MRKRMSAQLKEIGAKHERRKQAILRQSTQDVIEDMQTPVAKGGNMPVDFGFLRNSLATELDGQVKREAADDYTLTIAQLEPGKLFRVGYTAVYARARHYKPASFGQGGGHWRDKAAAKWKSFVAENTRRARGQ